LELVANFICKIVKLHLTILPFSSLLKFNHFGHANQTYPIG
jgi:hypothetical protein